MNFLEIAVRNARLTIVALSFFLIAGTVAYVGIPKEAEPDVQFPVVYVGLSLQGISPEDAERLLIRPLESELQNITGVDTMTASAYQGGGNIVVEFDPSADLSRALDDVRTEVDQAKGQFPPGTDEPSVVEVNISEFPVIVVTLSGDAPERVLTRAAKALRDRLEEVGGVLDANLQGSRDELVEVIIDPVKLSSYNLQLDQLVGGVGANNQLVAAGTLEGDEGRYAVKVPALIETVEDIANLPISVSGNAVVRARDLATIRNTFEDAETIARLNGKPAIAIEVSKRAGANLIETVDAVKAEADAFRSELPAGVEVTFSQDRSTNIRTLLDDLQNSVLTAVLLVFIVILFFLGFRSSLLIGLSIPTSFLMGILFLSLAGYTVNLVVLFSLILAVGMLVDDSIIVTEYAERRMAEGVAAAPAFAEAARRMFGPVVVSTLTRIAAFSPLLFWPGIVGEFMSYMPITLIATLSASTIYALLFAPTIGSIVGKAAIQKRRPDGLYMALIKRAVRFPILTILAVAVLLGGIIQYYVNNNNGVEFFPAVEPEYGLLYVKARGNLSLEEQDALVRRAEERLLDWPGIDTVYARSGSSRGGIQLGSGGGEDTIGTIQYEFVDWRERKAAGDILTDLRAEFASMPGVQIEISVPDAGPPQGKPIQVRLSADDPTGLETAAAEVAAYLETIPEVIDLNDGLPPLSVDWELKVDRTEAAKFGVGPDSVGRVVQLVTTGLKLSDYRPAGADDAVDIRLRLPEDRRTLSMLDQLRIETSGGAVPVTNFVSREPAASLGTLTRVDGSRTIDVTANLVEGAQDSVFQAQVAEHLATMDFPPNIRWEMVGSDQESDEAAAFLSQAFGVAIFLIFALLLAQFNRFTYVWLVLSAVVMSTIGVLLGLAIMQMPFSIIMSAVGTIALAGVVVNNNIVLIDTYARLRHEGVDKMEAVLETCRERVRPVMLTAVTAILGVLPIAFGINLALLSHEVTVGAPSTQWWVSLSSAIVFGLGFSTLLTLVVTPAALMLFTRDNEQLAKGNRILRLIRWLRARLSRQTANAGPGAAPPKAPARAPGRPLPAMEPEDMPDDMPGDVRPFPKAAE
ncbi:MULTISPECIES: efflux RND transporter permease subunit [unclassified Roseitalea]|uniref:efflux RND transporter permease subunit n=1 Tax=unclassified Roseitalea TaxID=2639107 RepID=UPI00273DAFF3|nr:MULTISPECIES: efflux RND transporter permease subunit [unclassified Roseitalea]